MNPRLLEQNDASAGSDSWWSSRRKAYNIGLVVAGILAFAAYVAVLSQIEVKPGEEPPESSLFTMLFQGIGYLIMMRIANLCYGLGPAVERVIPKARVSKYRVIAFWSGFIFSMALPFAIPVLAWFVNR